MLELVPTVGAFRGTDRRSDSLTWYGRRLYVCLFKAQFELRRGRDAPAVLDELLPKLLELHDLRTCDRFRR